MRIVLLIFALASFVTCYGCGHLNAGTRTASTAGVPASGTTRATVTPGSSAVLPESANGSTKDGKVAARVDFASQIKPILEARCQPCHFNGGKVYAKMPFDRPETIKTMGTKLFTRIKDENERRLIRDFLAQE